MTFGILELVGHLQKDSCDAWLGAAKCKGTAEFYVPGFPSNLQLCKKHAKQLQRKGVNCNG